MKRGLFVLSLVLFVVFWGAASWIGGWLYICEPPTCQLRQGGPMLVAAIATLLVMGAVILILRNKRTRSG